MSDPPSGDQLLALARDLLLRELLPLLPEERRIDARMIGNAMGIAARELTADAAAAAALGRDLAILLESEAGGEPVELGRRLAVALRAGRFDGSAELHALLLRSVRHRLTESNPKALRMDDEG